MMIIFTFLLLCQYSDEVTVISTNTHETSCQVVFSQERIESMVPLTRFVVSESTPICLYTISTYAPTQHTVDGTTLSDTPVKVGDPILVGSQRVYPLHVYANHLNNNIKITAKAMEIRVLTQNNTMNHTMPASLFQAYKGLIINGDNMVPALPQGYLIIVPDAMYTEVLPLALWKEKKGWHRYSPQG